MQGHEPRGGGASSLRDAISEPGACPPPASRRNEHAPSRTRARLRPAASALVAVAAQQQSSSEWQTSSRELE